MVSHVPLPLNYPLSIIEGSNLTDLSAKELAEFKDQFTIPLNDRSQTYPIKLKRLSPVAKVPTYGTKHAACFDIYSSEEITLFPEHTYIIGTGWSMEIPIGTKLHITSRSGMSTKGIIVTNAPGTIDADYRGEVKIVLSNLDRYNPYTIKVGDRIAQGEVTNYTGSTFFEVDELSTTDRGEGGLGHTGR